jgi:hypothetical protein
MHEARVREVRIACVDLTDSTVPEDLEGHELTDWELSVPD